MSTGWLTTRQAGPLDRVPGDYGYLEDVVRVGYPVRAARTFLNRHLGNPVGYRLVEAERGETVGEVREIAVISKDGAETVRIRAIRTLPDGTPATYFAPEDLVETRAQIETETGGPVPPIQVGDRIVLNIPVRSYLRFLPGLYRGAAPTQRRDYAQVTERSAQQWASRDQGKTTAVQVHHADQFRRFLFIFQHLMTTVTEKIDRIPSLTDPMEADPRFLPWIASWVSFELDGSLPLHQQRELVRRSIRLHRTRGTRAGVEEMIRVLTSAPVRLEENSPPRPCILNGMTLAGGKTPAERYLRREPPGHYVMRDGQAKTGFFVLKLEDRGAFDRRFGERGPAILRRISQIVTNERPAHVTFTIEFEERV